MTHYPLEAPCSSKGDKAMSKSQELDFTTSFADKIANLGETFSRAESMLRYGVCTNALDDYHTPSWVLVVSRALFAKELEGMSRHYDSFYEFEQHRVEGEWKKKFDPLVVAIVGGDKATFDRIHEERSLGYLQHSLYPISHRRKDND